MPHTEHESNDRSMNHTVAQIRKHIRNNMGMVRINAYGLPKGQTVRMLKHYHEELAVLRGYPPNMPYTEVLTRIAQERDQK